MPRAVDILAEIVRIPSVNPMGRDDLPTEILYEARLADYWQRRFRDLGVPVERVEAAPGRPNIVARFEPRNPSGHLLWDAHLDTVPVDGMTIDPFGAEVRNGRLYGRGACDVKAGAAAMFAAFERLVKERPPNSAAVTLSFTADEEDGMLGVRHLAASGIRADFAVVAEPTDLNLVVAHKGVARWTLETIGVACHSSRPEQGVNAVYRMAKMLNAIEDYSSELSRRPGSPSISVGTIHGGSSANTVPDRCRIDIDRRLAPGELPVGALSELEARLKRSELDFSVIPARDACPALAATDSPWLERLAATIGSPLRESAPYGTNAGVLQSVAGIPSVVFGPGNIAQAHTHDEWVELEQVEKAAEILFRFAAGL